MKIVALGAWGVPDLFNSLYLMQKQGIEIAAVVCAQIEEKLVDLTSERAGGYFVPKTMADLFGPAIPFYFVERHDDERCQDLLKNLAPDIVLNLGTPNILKTETLALPSIGVLNCHPGSLPEYRGCTCVEWAIYNDDPVAATCHFMTEKIDEGPIICIEIMTVVPHTPYAKIRAGMLDHQCQTMIKGIRRIALEGLRFSDLPPQGDGTYYSVIPKAHLAEIATKTENGSYSCGAV
jgi:methionyl-tRNA formyltransferase